ncbi:MAG: response regulator [Chloroflexi bacterium]|nr:response regulator [Chloroflexota bacterium]
MAKILVIDDEDSLQKLMKYNLVARGHQVLLASNGETGVEVAQQECPDLIFLDLMMPGISGWDVLTGLKTDERLKKVPVIVTTAADRGKLEEQALALGAFSYLVKPFGVEELLQLVERAVGE